MQTVWIYESELRAIAHETFQWELETGGDLFGLWDPEPVVLLATRLGPKGERNAHHCRLDLSFLWTLSPRLDRDWGLSYFGDWHSHHRKRVIAPSRADRERLRRIAERRQFQRMIECLVTCSSYAPEVEPALLVHSFAYDQPDWHSPQELEIGVIPGISPIRETLIVRGELPNQKLSAWEVVTPSRIPCLQTSRTPATGIVQALLGITGSHLLRQLNWHLAATFHTPTEDRVAPFGRIVSIGIGAGQVAIALGLQWPHPLLQVDRIDSGMYSSQPLACDAEGITALNLNVIEDVCQAALQGRLAPTTIAPTGQPLICVTR